MMTGCGSYDYLGEPSPYDEYWPSRSSYFGICDLSGLPKDRYYLYRSHWNKEAHTIHLLPHWSWGISKKEKGNRIGEVTPVYCYTDYRTFCEWQEPRKDYKES